MCQHSPSSLHAISADALVVASASAPAANRMAWLRGLIARSPLRYPIVPELHTSAPQDSSGSVRHALMHAPVARRKSKRASVADQSVNGRSKACRSRFGAHQNLPRNQTKAKKNEEESVHKREAAPTWTSGDRLVQETANLGRYERKGQA